MATFNEIMNIENGARFHNADLHIHTFGGSHDVFDATMTPEAIVASAVNQGLSVIAITDRFRLKARPEIQMIANHNSADSASRDLFAAERPRRRHL